MNRVFRIVSLPLLSIRFVNYLSGPCKKLNFLESRFLSLLPFQCVLMLSNQLSFIFVLSLIESKIVVANFELSVYKQK